MKYCTNCGKEIIEGADVCLGCGKFINKKLNQPEPQKVKNTSPKAKSIASFILGLISVLWTLSMIATLEQGVETLIVEYYYNHTIIYLIAYYIGYTLFALSPGIVGLILGIKSNKQTLSKTGIILSSISLVACFLILVKFIINI